MRLAKLSLLGALVGFAAVVGWLAGVQFLWVAYQHGGLW